MFTDGAEKSAFTPFEVSLNYLKAYDPAKKYKFSIICSSSKNGAEFAGAPGSELIVDDIEIINAEQEYFPDLCKSGIRERGF